MQNKRIQSVFLILFCPVILAAQNFFISKFVPGNFQKDNRHLVDIFNPGPQPLDISNYLLVTRDYVAKLPGKMTIPPGEVLSICKNYTKPSPTQLSLIGLDGFVFRPEKKKYPGNYVVLFNREGSPMDGMYFSPDDPVPILDEHENVSFPDGSRAEFHIPAQNDPFWKVHKREQKLSPDPAIYFINLDTFWIATSVIQNLVLESRYTLFSANYVGQTMKISWTSEQPKPFNEGFPAEAFSLFHPTKYFFHHVERSDDGQNFTTVSRVQAKNEFRAPVNYGFIDKKIDEGRNYFYRMRNVDIYGNVIYSRIIEVSTESATQDFVLDAFFGKGDQQDELNIRYMSRIAQKIRIKLLDDHFREIAILYDDPIEKEKDNLIKIPGGLAAGNYTIIAETSEKRYFKEVQVQ